MNPSSPYSIERLTKAAWRMARLASICDAAEVIRFRKLFTARTPSQHKNAWDRYELLIKRKAWAMDGLCGLLNRLTSSGMESQAHQIYETIPAWSRSARSLTYRNPGIVAGSDGSREIGCDEVLYASSYGLRNI